MTITLQHIESTDSTNRLIKALNENTPLVHGHCLYADFQTAGKGQGSNSWESDSGKNLLFSLWLDTPQFPLLEQFLLSEVVAVSLVNVLHRYLPEVGLKWPNDIYVGNKKLGGILIETIIMKGVMKNAVIGVGLNVNQTEFRSDAPNPVSMCQLLCKETDLQSLLTEIVAEMSVAVRDFTIEQSGEWQQRYDSLLFWREGYHDFADKNGRFRAKISKILPNGQLILETESRETRGYFLKEVRFVI